MASKSIIDDENYASSEDSDFAPEDVPDQASSAESDDEDAADVGESESLATAAKRTRRKDGEGDVEAEDAGFENSGDEAVIGKGKKRRKRDGDGEDAADSGGFVKTRSQRANEKAERRAAVVQGPVTVDVDALWAQMMGGSNAQAQSELASLATAAVAAAASDDAGNVKTDGIESAMEAKGAGGGETEMIKIKRTYNFAGKVHTEEKMVARTSAEAKLYLAEMQDQGADQNAESEQPKRLPRKAFRSAFEPVLDISLQQAGGGGATRRADLDLGMGARLQARERAAQQEQAKKLNTVEKSRMDWAGFVDREGIQAELALAGKSKGAFADRQQFLVRTEMRREEEARRARLAGKA